MITRHLTIATVAVSAILAHAPAFAANVANGQTIYQRHCAGCHGIRGDSAIPNAPNFSRGERMMQADFALMQSIKAGKAMMPSFNGIIRDQEILDVISYIRTLNR